MADEYEQRDPADFDLYQRLGTHIPGDRVYIESFIFSHEMHIDVVRAVFQHQDSPEKEIVLEGEPVKEMPSRNEEGGRVIFRSSVLLKTFIPPDAAPGQYKCGTLYAQTYTGQWIAFEDRHNEVDWTIWVLTEPTIPPKFGVW